MSVYGLHFKITVIESLKLLDSKEAKEYTLADIFDCFVQKTGLNPSKQYKTTLKARIRLCLVEWCEVGWCVIERRTHPTNNYTVLYYQLNKNNVTKRA